MTNNSILEQGKFWKVMKFLTELESPQTLSSICKNAELNEWELNAFLNFLEEMDYSFSLSKNLNGEKVFSPPTDKPKFTFEFSLLEWAQFQAHFPKISECDESPYHEGFKNKLEDLENKFNRSELFTPALTLDNVLKEFQPTLVTETNNPTKEVLIFLEESILDKKVVQLKTQGCSIRVFPRRVIYFDGRLNLVAEDTQDKSLINIDINLISQAFEEGDTYRPDYSKIQVDDFVSSLRSMTDSQVRLVLKIYSNDKFRLNFNSTYFDNPCLFTNPEGDFIWAATLEPSEVIFEWLCELGAAVEILDPSEFKSDFIKYCEHKLKKLA